MTKNDKAKFEAGFRHNTRIGQNGELLFDAPLEIKTQADLDNYHITWNDCKVLNFHGSEKVTVYFYQTTDVTLANDAWAYLDTQHSRGYASTRCMIPGKRKAFIRCPDTTSCANCPHKENKQPPVISWDSLIETGYEPESTESVEHQVMIKLEYEAIRTRMNAEDPRIAIAFESKELYGDSVKKIADELGISTPRVYQLISRAKAIGRQFREDNDNE